VAFVRFTDQPTEINVGPIKTVTSFKVLKIVPDCFSVGVCGWGWGAGIEVESLSVRLLTFFGLVYTYVRRKYLLRQICTWICAHCVCLL
jgi:hypothetical protein